jgi:hypothetical protein
LGDLVLAHPKASGQGHLNLIFIRRPFRLVGRTPHGESAWRAPTEFDAKDVSLFPCFPAVERRANHGPGWIVGCAQPPEGVATEDTERQPGD